MRPHTYTQPKPLILVAGKPIISFIIDQLVGAGVSEFIFVLGYLGEKIKSYLDTEYGEIQKTYIQQEVRRGLGDAILKVRGALKEDDEIVILLGDTILELDMRAFLGRPSSVIATQKVKDPRLFGVVEVDDRGVITKVVEKPSIPKSNLAITGLYKIKEVELLMNCLQEVDGRIEEGQELHLADGLMEMIHRGAIIETSDVRHWYDCGKKEVLLETNKALLNKANTDVGTRYMFDHTIIIPPVVYGSSCQFSNAIIGPNVTLGNNVHIKNSLLSDSILGDYVRISGAVLRQSVIGNDATIKGLSQSLNIGDNNEIDFTQG